MQAIFITALSDYSKHNVCKVYLRLVYSTGTSVHTPGEQLIDIITTGKKRTILLLKLLYLFYLLMNFIDLNTTFFVICFLYLFSDLKFKKYLKSNRTYRYAWSLSRILFRRYSVLSDILVKNELCRPLERGLNVLSTDEGFICLSPPSKLKIVVCFCSIYKKTISFSAIVIFIQ